VRVVMVTEFAYPLLGGISEHVHFLSSELVALGHDVTVLTSRLRERRGETREVDREMLDRFGYRTERIGNGIPVVSNKSVAHVTMGLRVKPQVAYAIRDADVVHAQGLAAPMLPLWALRTSRAPVNVGTYHTYFTRDSHLLYQLFYRYVSGALRRLDRRIAVSEPCVDAINPLFPARYDVIPNGVDCDLFRPLAPGEDPGGPPRILFVGRFEPRNALGTLLDACARLRRSGRRFVLEVVGDGPLRSHYQHSAARLGVTDLVRWRGALRDERARYYREATVFAAPCTLASFGVVLLEALASGAPIVCADNIGFRQVMRDGAPGRFTRPDDPEDLARGLAEVLDDAALRADWSERGRRIALERYAWPQVARQVEAVYREVLEDKGGSNGRPAG
jgi:phosphatidyl-myo-inositol alpha-mannosyltransferase